MRIVETARDRILEPCSLGSFEFQLDPYVGCAHHCVYCYAQNDVPLDWESEVGIQPRLARKVQAELRDLAPQTIYMGMNTDPYQPAERDQGQSRLALEILADAGFSVCILTKSDLVLRDAELIGRMEGPSVGFSVAFTDEDVRSALEKDTIPLKARLEALSRLHQMGIETYALINPVVPGLTDVDALIDMFEPHADTIWVYPLTMARRDGANWKAMRDVLERRFPERLAMIERAAFAREHHFWARLRRGLAARAGRVNARIEIHV